MECRDDHTHSLYFSALLFAIVLPCYSRNQCDTDRNRMLIYLERTRLAFVGLCCVVLRCVALRRLEKCSNSNQSTVMTIDNR
mmetsp:Transcript_2910/g.6125  ORF Transcript_2910/g.6125 Transcript_2910/m.6125 type:complete len:82 (+) Transcript_2910:470-715(+)